MSESMKTTSLYGLFRMLDMSPHEAAWNVAVAVVTGSVREAKMAARMELIACGMGSRINGE